MGAYNQKSMTLLNVEPPSKPDFIINIPGSKSITNRALIISSLAKGQSTILNASCSDDTKRLLLALNKLGIKILSGHVRVSTLRITSKRTLRIFGTNGIIGTNASFSLGNAGSSLRFITGLLCISRGNYIVDGDKRMRKRPIQGLVDALNELGGKVRSLRNNCCLPISIDANGLEGGTCHIKGDISSQFISSILLVSPYAKNDVCIEVEGQVVSKPYIDITSDVMSAFGVYVENFGYRKFFVKAGQRYRNRIYRVDGDGASANYFFGIAAVLGGRTVVKGISTLSVGELKFVDVLKKMGCNVLRGPDYIEVSTQRRYTALKSCGKIDMSDMPDSVQTLAVLSLFADGPTLITNIANQCYKETDRIRALATELAKIGAKVKPFSNALMIIPMQPTLQVRYKPVAVETYNDHRMAMSFTIAGMRIRGLSIKNPDCVSKSLPEFWSLLREAGFRVKLKR